MSSMQKDAPSINKNIHPPIVAVIHIALAYLIGYSLRLPFILPEVVRLSGFGLTIIGFLFGVGAFIEFHKAQTTLDPHGTVKALVTNGVYRLTRNPIYLGFLLIIIGLPLNSGHLSGIVVAPLFMTTLSRLVIEKEEAYLEKKFKGEYTSYKSSVRRWI